MKDEMHLKILLLKSLGMNETLEALGCWMVDKEKEKRKKVGSIAHCKCVCVVKDRSSKDIYEWVWDEMGTNR